MLPLLSSWAWICTACTTYILWLTVGESVCLCSGRRVCFGVGQADLFNIIHRDQLGDSRRHLLRSLLLFPGHVLSRKPVVSATAATCCHFFVAADLFLFFSSTRPFLCSFVQCIPSSSNVYVSLFAPGCVVGSGRRLFLSMPCSCARSPSATFCPRMYKQQERNTTLLNTTRRLNSRNGGLLKMRRKIPPHGETWDLHHLGLDLPKYPETVPCPE